ncbi:SIS domain-containing protein (plasmid) [Hymenobacter monticola]|uniref:SIS domain-containing protein n=1 Tax=Hymenobacter monticola TaxID=1705399 RepID=A0ABY4BCF8_9BACT|nr:SIS domain-containing protein [Hymenobacter monticola]UOE36830.1 SIS domain-containing protein [Hymenobacter monticola]
MFEYVEKINAQLLALATSQAPQITAAAEWFAHAIVHEHMIHAVGTGHSQMVAMELFTRASGLANVNTVLDDLVLSASGARRRYRAGERASGYSMGQI